MAEVKQFIGIVSIDDEGIGVIDIVHEEAEVPIPEVPVVRPVPGRA